MTMFVGLFWIVNGHGSLPFRTRIVLVAAALAVLAVILILVEDHTRRLRRNRNRAYCADRGYVFLMSGSMDDVFHDASLFQEDDICIEQIVRGDYRNVPFEVFDLSYTITLRDNDGAGSVHRVSQTVASVSCQASADVRLLAIPSCGWSGAFANFLGLTASIEAQREMNETDKTLARWFGQNYSVIRTDESACNQTKCLLHTPLFKWLREHSRLAFEVVEDRILVWRTNQVVEAALRDDLVEEAIQLARILQQGPGCKATAVFVNPPVVVTPGGLALCMIASAITSSIIAAAFAMLCFFGGLSFGWLQWAPKPFLIGMMTLTMIVWIGSSVYVHSRISRWYRSLSTGLRGDCHDR